MSGNRSCGRAPFLSLVGLTMLTVVACDDGGGADTRARVDTPFTLSAFDSREAIPNATVTYEGEAYVTDAEGIAVVPLIADAPWLVVVTGDGFREHHLHGLRPSSSTAFTIATDSAIFLTEQVFNKDVDDTKALASVGVVDAATGASIPGMKLTVAPAPELSLVFDASSGAGLSEGDTTLEGSSSRAIFVNPAAGNLTPAFSHPDGYMCDVGPQPLNAPAGVFVIASYECHTP